MEKLCGIYKITCLSTGHIYIGQSQDIRKRIMQQKTNLKRNVVANPKLRELYNLYGLNNFSFETLELCVKELLDERERFWIAQYGGIESDLVCNMESGGHKGKTYCKDIIEHKSNLYKGKGLPRGEKTRFQKGKKPWNAGKTLSKEYREKLSKAHLGKPVSIEARIKISQKLKGKPKNGIKV